MSDARIEAYSRALFEVAQAEGNLAVVEDELFRMARAVESSEQLRGILTDATIPADRRQQVVEQLLGGKASNTSVQLVSLIVGSGRGRDLPAIVDRLVQRASSEQQREVNSSLAAMESTRVSETQSSKNWGNDRVNIDQRVRAGNQNTNGLARTVLSNHLRSNGFLPRVIIA